MKITVHYARATLLCIAMLCGAMGLARAEDPPLTIGLYMAVIREVPRKDVELSLRFWIDELSGGHEVNYKPIKLYDDIKNMVSDLKTGEINFIVAPGIDIVDNLQLDKLTDGFAGYRHSRDDVLLLVRRGAKITTPADLRGKRLSLLDDDLLMDKYMQTLLMRAGLRSNMSQLGSVIRETRCNKQINQLFFGQADAALVYSSSFEIARELNPQIAQRVQALDAYTFHIRSPYFGLFSTSVPPEYRERITNFALLLDNKARGRQVLQVYNADVMERTRVSDLKPFEILNEEYRKLLQAEKKGKR